MTAAVVDDILFPPIEPYRHGMLVVDPLHTLYWEESGNPHGIPVLFLHGGPGSGTSPRQRRFFDPAHYRIVLFDQRGAGKSTPLGSCADNTTPLLVEDIEQLRRMLGIDRWLVFGGSWGSTLALAYGQAHPQCCLGFILRGIFLCGRSEIDWFLYGMEQFFPEVHAEFVAAIPLEERTDLLQAYRRRLFGDDAAASAVAARAWSRYEGSCLYLMPDPAAVEEFSSDAISLGLGRLEAHYFLHDGFMEPDQLLRNVGQIAHLPVVIIQGRYDVVCPPVSAFRLHQAWPQARLQMIDAAGHAAFEPDTARALVQATESFRRNGTL
ncbi:MAG: prolyl aminopeptidase [Herminiimonas sp.]|nr:prolyl aminopeptidase [Herminiimonas sp.]